MQARIGNKIDITALAAVTAIGPASGHKFLPAEADAAIAAPACADIKFGFVSKTHD